MVTQAKSLTALSAPDGATVRKAYKIYDNVPGKPALEINLPCCGETRTWHRSADIPDKDIGPCDCGNWFICYEANEEA